MEVTKTIRPGDNGSKRYQRTYGDRLVCVRYRNDRENRRNLVTVELIVAEHPHTSVDEELIDQLSAHPNRWALLRISREEKQLQQSIRRRGGKWIQSRELWGLSYQIVQELKLEERMVAESALPWE